MDSGQRFRFRPSPLPSVVALVLLALFAGLGKWQLERAKEKQEIEARRTELSALSPVPLKLPLEDVESWRYREVTLQGRFDGEHQFLLDNQVNAHRAGFNVFTPLRLGDGMESVLIDRGWVPGTNDRQILPEIALSGSVRKLSGTVYAPFARGFRIGDMDVGVETWPKVIQYLDFDQIGDRLGYRIAPLVVRMSPREPDGYLREWTTAPFSSNRHLGYAVQWFALAAGLIVIYLALTIKRS